MGREGGLYTLRETYYIRLGWHILYTFGAERERENLSVRCRGDFVLDALKRRGNTDELDQLKD